MRWHLVCRWMSLTRNLFIWLLLFFLPAPSASLDMMQRAKSSMLKSIASTSWASTCQSTWATWWRRTRMRTRSSSPASSRMESPPIRQVLLMRYEMTFPPCITLYQTVSRQQNVFLLISSDLWRRDGICDHNYLICATWPLTFCLSN